MAPFRRSGARAPAVAAALIWAMAGCGGRDASSGLAGRSAGDAASSTDAPIGADAADASEPAACASCASSLATACGSGADACPPDLGSPEFPGWVQRRIAPLDGAAPLRPPACIVVATVPSSSSSSSAKASTAEQSTSTTQAGRSGRSCTRATASFSVPASPPTVASRSAVSPGSREPWHRASRR